MKRGTINILGTDYAISVCTAEERPKFRNNNGMAELYNRELVVQVGYEDDPEVFDNVEAFKHKVLRHECFHAIFHEAGHYNYCEDEKLVNALAVMWPKIKCIIEQAEAIDLTPEEVEK